MTARTALPIPFSAEVVFAIGGDFFFLHDQSKGGVEVVHGFTVAQVAQVGGDFLAGLGQVVLLNRSTLGAEVEAVVFHFEEGDVVGLAGQGAVEEEDGSLHSGIGLEDAGRQGNDGDEVVLEQHAAQLFISALALKDDALGDDDAGASGGGEVLSHVVHEEHLAAFRFDGESVVRTDASLGRHEGRIGQDDVRVFIPAFLAGEGVVFVYVRVDELVQVHVDQRETYHVRGDVVAFDIAGQSFSLIGRERVEAFIVAVVFQDVLVGGDEESGGAAGRVEQAFVLLEIDEGHHEVDDMTRGAELTGISLGTEDGEQVLESVSQAFRVVVGELVDDLQEAAQRLRVVVGQVGVPEDVPEERRDTGILRHPADGFAIKSEDFVTSQPGADQPGPPETGEVPGKELTIATQLFTLGVDVIHELVNEGDGDLLHLALGVGDFAHQDVTGVVDAAFGVGVQHGNPLGGELVQGNVILDVLRNQGLVWLRNGLEIREGKDGIGGKIGEIPGIDDVADLVAGQVRFEKGLDGRYGEGFLYFVIVNEFVEFLFEQFVPGFETGDEVEDLFQDLSQAQAPVHGGGFAQLVEAVVFLGFVEHFMVDVVDNALPLSGFDGLDDRLVLAHGIREPVEEHAVDFHALEADGRFTDMGEGVLLHVFITIAGECGAVLFLHTNLQRRGLGELQDLVVVELVLEIFAIAEEIEELEGGFLLLRWAEVFFETGIGKLFRKVMLARAASLDLDEIGGRKDRAEHAEIEKVGAVVAGGHHTHGDADAGFAGTVRRLKITGAEQVVVGEIDGELLGVRYPGSDLNGEIGLVLAGKDGIRELIQDLGETGGMILADGEDDGLADFTTDWVTQGMFQESAAKKKVGRIGEELLLELPFPVAFLMALAGVVPEGDDESFFGEEGSGHLRARIDHGGVDQTIVLDAVEQ